MVKKEDLFKLALLGVGGYLAYTYLLPRIMKPEEEKPPPEEVPQPPPTVTNVTVTVYNDLNTRARIYLIDAYYDLDPNASITRTISTPGNYELRIISPDGAYVDTGTPGYHPWVVNIIVSEGQVDTREYRIKWIPGYTPPTPSPTPPTPPPPPTPETVTITFTSSPFNVNVICLYPEASGTTPLTVTVEKGKVVTYQVPREVEVGYDKYVFSSASDSYVVTTNSYVTLKTLADTSKTVSIVYELKLPTTPLRVYDLGRQGRIALYDVWYRPSTRELFVDVEVTCGTTGDQTDMVGAVIVAHDDISHGFLLGSVGCGRHRNVYTDVKDWHISYGVGIHWRTRYGGIFLAFIYPRNEIRTV